MLTIGMFAAFLTVIFDVMVSILAKYAIKRMNNYKLTVLLLGIGIVPMFIYLILTGSTSITEIPALYSIVAGVFLCMGFVLNYKSLSTQQVTNTAAITPLQQLIILSSGIFIFGEHLVLLQIIGVIAIFGGVTLVSTRHGLKLNRFLIPAIFANICWAIYWVFLAYGVTLLGSSVFPTLIARVSGFLIILAYAYLTGKLIDKRSKKLSSPVFDNLLILVVILGGLFDAGINLSFSFAISTGIVAIGSAIFATAPIFVAILAKIIYKDRLTKLQLLGIIAAVLGTIIISLA